MSNKEYLVSKAQTICVNKIEILKWFVDDDSTYLFTMLEEGTTLDQWYESMQYRIIFFENKYYVLEEEDLLEYIEEYLF